MNGRFRNECLDVHHELKLDLSDVVFCDLFIACQFSHDVVSLDVVCLLSFRVVFDEVYYQEVVAPQYYTVFFCLGYFLFQFAFFPYFFRFSFFYYWLISAIQSVRSPRNFCINLGFLFSAPFVRW